jgi:hypothetical protein
VQADIDGVETACLGSPLAETLVDQGEPSGGAMPATVVSVTMKIVNAGYFEFTLYPGVRPDDPYPGRAAPASVVDVGTSQLVPGHASLWGSGFRLPHSTLDPSLGAK